MPNYLPTISEVIIQTLKDNLHGDYGIRSYYNGDPLIFPKEYLPAITVEKEEGVASQTSTQRDDLSSKYVIKVVFNKEDDFNNLDTLNTTQQKMERIIEGRDNITKQYMTDTLLGVLRANFTLGNRLTDQKATVQYGVTKRPDDTFTSEGHIRLDIEERIILSAPRT